MCLLDLRGLGPEDGRYRQYDQEHREGEGGEGKDVDSRNDRGDNFHGNPAEPDPDYDVSTPQFQTLPGLEVLGGDAGVARWLQCDDFASLRSVNNCEDQ